MQGEDGGKADADDRFACRAMDGFGAFMLGRTLFGRVRGDWPDKD